MQIYFSVELRGFFFFFLPQVEKEAPVWEDHKQDGHQPGEPDTADTPEGDTVGTDERTHHTNGLPDAPESGERGEEAIMSQHDGESREEESVGLFEQYVLFVHLNII